MRVPTTAAAVDPRSTSAYEELEARLERLQEAFASLGIGVVDGYFVKVWTDPDSGEWVAECPTVKVVAQGETREEALEAVAELTRAMLESLAEVGADVPTRDVQLP
jgi:predicted RNase H-like HicB family nuclease